MKKTMFHRFGALALSMMMVCSLMATPAFATGDPSGGTTGTESQENTGSNPSGTETGDKLTLTINNVIKDTEYKIYKVLSLDYEAGQEATENIQARRATYAYTYDADSKAALKTIVDGGYGLVQENGNYKVELDENGKYVSGMRGYDKNGDKSAAYFTLNDTHLVFQLMVKPEGETAYRLADDQEYADWAESNFGKQFAADFGNALRASISNIAFTGMPVATVEANDTTIKTAGDKKYIEVQLDPGYYLIDSGANRRVMTGSLFAGGDNTINEKNSKPTLDKKVLLDNGDNQYGKENDKGVGDLVHYRVEIDTGAGVTGLRFKDTLSKGLTFVSLDSIQFFGRNADGKVFSSSDEDTNKKNADNGIKAPVWDLNWDQGDNSELVVNSNRAAYADGKYGNPIGTGGSLTAMRTLIDANDSTSVKDGYHNFNVDASYADNVIEIVFAKEWLMSKRAENSDTVGTAANRGQFTMDPMQPGDSRLPDGFSGDAALFNQYIGDTTTTADDGGIIVIYYTAKINKDAVINDVGNPNGAHLDYSNDPEFDPDGENPPWEPSKDDHTTTYVYVMDLLKHATGDEKIKLQGAKFEVRKAGYDEEKSAWLTVADESKVTVPAGFADKFKNGNDLKAPIEFVEDTVKVSETENKTVYRVATAEEKAAEGYAPITKLETNANGQIEVIGLDSDLYQLKETVAPDGYIKMDDNTYVYVVIGGVESKKVETTGEGTDQVTTTIETVDRGSKTEGDKTLATVTAKVFVQNGGQTSNEFVKKNPVGMSIYAFGVENASGMKMPETGGIGTTIFYVLGGTLAVAAVVLLVAKKRMGKSEE